MEFPTQSKLTLILQELQSQPEAGVSIPPGEQSLSEQLQCIGEWIDVREFGIAYDTLVALLETCEFRMSGKAAVCLLEVGLFFGFKNSRTPK